VLTRINQLTDVVGSLLRWLPGRCRGGLCWYEHPRQDSPDIEADPSHCLRANPVECKQAHQDGPDIDAAASYCLRAERVEWRRTHQDGPDIEADPSHWMRSEAVEWRNNDENELRSRLAQLENAISACLQMAALVADVLSRDPPPAVQACEPLISAKAIASVLNVSLPAIKTYLTRFAAKNPDCRVEQQNRRIDEPSYLYRSAVVMTPLRKHFRL
jgi:hypothetical protein